LEFLAGVFKIDQWNHSNRDDARTI